VQRGEYPPRFALPHAVKDADLVHEAAALPVLGAVRDWLHAATARDPGRDYVAVVDEILRSR
jgi:3-hydroxyisobutyrate dehydrogenase-like beta-hydroxyacid dehydrogenase